MSRVAEGDRARGPGLSEPPEGRVRDEEKSVGDLSGEDNGFCRLMIGKVGDKGVEPNGEVSGEVEDWSPDGSTLEEGISLGRVREGTFRVLLALGRQRYVRFGASRRRFGGAWVIVGGQV